jgi:hypothetical protein
MSIRTNEIRTRPARKKSVIWTHPRRVSRLGWIQMTLDLRLVDENEVSDDLPVQVASFLSLLIGQIQSLGKC